jgi:ATP-dependent DNA ligase
LLQRLHPAASRVDRLSQLTPASFIAFDVLAVDKKDLRSLPFTERRDQLTELMAAARPPLFLIPCTNDPEIANDWMGLSGGGIDGVVVEESTIAYTPGRRTMLKIKRNRTAECVVAGFRWHYEEPAVGSLLLGLYDGEILRHAGLAASFTRSQRSRMADDVVDHVVPLERHPWEHGFNVAGAIGRLPGAASRWGYGNEITWVPLCPDLVCEVVYDHIEEYRFRHPPRFVRWRPDRSARSCTYDQFWEARVEVAEILARTR